MVAFERCNWVGLVGGSGVFCEFGCFTIPDVLDRIRIRGIGAARFFNNEPYRHSGMGNTTVGLVSATAGWGLWPGWPVVAGVAGDGGGWRGLWRSPRWWRGVGSFLAGG